MKRSIAFRREADLDVRSIQAWYDSQRAGLGAVFAGRVVAVIDRIAERPESYGEIRPGIRAALVPRHRHVVYYRVLSDRIEILAVLHGSRDPAVLTSRLSEQDS